ncbi:MAG: hypothetical protein IPK16_06370 [Anaerolineales bacterium]|nr:hypothetical protein [Anaerolineales bacterium]
MSEPPKADILLLRRHGRHWSEAQRQLLPDGVRDRQASHHLLECKFTESCNAAALQQALGYDYFYRQTQQLAAGELQTYVVSAKTPQRAFLARFGYTPAEHPGVYVTAQPLLDQIVLLVLNQLRHEPQNEFLRLFASQQRVRRETISTVVRQHTVTPWAEQLLAVVFGLQRLYQMEENAMQKELTVEDVMVIGDKLRKQAIASATPEEMLAVLSPEAMLAVLSPEERLAGLSPEERLAGLAPEELEQLRAAINAQLAKEQQAKPQHRRKSGNR